MTSSDFEKNIFSFSIQDKTCDNDICYMNGYIQNAIQDETLKKKLEKFCDRLILCVDEFELTALSVFENNYVKTVKRIKVKMICQTGHISNLIEVTDRGVTSYQYTYNANGNLTRECYRNKAEVIYQYDAENHLVAVYAQQKLL